MSAKKPKSALFIIFLVVFIDLVGFGIVIPILPYYAVHYGASATELGILFTMYSLMQFLFAPMWGRLSDRIGRRPVLLISILGSSLGLAILGMAPSLLWLFIGRTFSGICGANLSTAYAYIGDITTEKNRAKGMGLIGAAFGIGFIFGPAIGGTLSRFGYGAPMFFAAALALANFVFAYIRLEESSTSQKEREKSRTKKFDLQAIKDSFGSARSRTAITLYFFITVAFVQMEVTFALFVKERFLYNAEQAGWLLVYTGVIMAIVQGGLIGKLSRKFGEGKLVMTGAILMMSGLIVMTKSPTVWHFLAGLTLFGFGHGVNSPSLTSLASLGAMKGKQGATMGVFQSSSALARVLAPPVAGLIFDRMGMEKPFLTAAGLMFVVFLLTIVWRRHIFPKVKA